MRITCVALLLLSSCVYARPASAAPGAQPDAKEWHHDLTEIRGTYPEVEPNDVCPGQGVDCYDLVVPARINSGGDLDWYSFHIDHASALLTIGTDASPVCGPDAEDTVLELYDSDCTTLLAFDDDGGPGL